MVEDIRLQKITDRLERLERAQFYPQKLIDELGNGSTGDTLMPDPTALFKFAWGTGDMQIGDNLLITSIGGIAIKLINRTGHSSVKGEIVESSGTTDLEVTLLPSGAVDPIGAIYNAGIAEGSNVWVVVAGIVQVLYDANGAINGGWVETSNATAGRADGSAATPAASPQHFEEMGHALEDAAANTLGKMTMHFL